MRRTDEAFKSELFRRYRQYKKNRRNLRILAIAPCALSILLIFAIVFLPRLSPWLSNTPIAKQPSTTTTGTTTTGTTTTGTTTTPDVIPETPVFEYRPDLIWEYYIPDGNGGYIGYENENDMASVYEPGPGVFILRFVSIETNLIIPQTPHYVHPEDANKRFAVYFGYKDVTPADWDALVAYLTGLGYEEVGKEGGFSIPIFAMTVDDIIALDCTTLQEKMGISTSGGLDVMISANKDEDNNYSHHIMSPWVTVDKTTVTKPFADLQTDGSSASSVNLINTKFYPESGSMGQTTFDSQKAAQKENFNRIIDFLKHLDLEPIVSLPNLTSPFLFDVTLKHNDNAIERFTVRGQHLIIHGDEDTYYEMSRNDAQDIINLLTGREGYEASTDPLNRLFEGLGDYGKLTCIIQDLANKRYTKFDSDPERLQSITDCLSELPLTDMIWSFEASEDTITQKIEFYADPDSTDPLLCINLYARRNMIELKPSSGSSIWYSYYEYPYEQITALMDFFKTV